MYLTEEREKSSRGKNQPRQKTRAFKSKKKVAVMIFYVNFQGREIFSQSIKIDRGRGDQRDASALVGDFNNTFNLLWQLQM